MQVDPAMERTVLVSTKFDTRLGQFAKGEDANAFLHPPKEHLSGGSMLGDAPFFTSVPSGRVGTDEKFDTDEDFQAAVKKQQEQDQKQLVAKMGRKLTREEVCHLGVYQLRNFLEVVLQQQYRAHIPAITNILSQQTRKLEAGVRDVEAAQQMLSEENIKFHVQRLVLRVHKQVQGLLTASATLPERCGQTLLQERERAGSLQCPPGFTLNEDWEQSLLKRSGDQQLFAYAQYDRAMDEFREFVESLVYTEITKAEINNQCGVGPSTNAPSPMTVAANLAAEKANAFESLLPQLGERLKHVLERVMQLSRTVVSEQLQSTSSSAGSPALQGVDEAVLDCIHKHCSHFIEDCEAEARAAALLDLHSRTRFVTLEQDTSSALCDVVPCSADIAHAVQSIRSSTLTAPQILTNLVQKHANPFVIQARGRTIESVPKLTERIFGGIRTGFTDDAERKFNYKLLWPLQDRLLPYLQGCINQEDLETLWDIAEVKEELRKQHEQLTDDLQAVKDLNEQFNKIKKLLRKQPRPAMSAL